MVDLAQSYRPQAATPQALIRITPENRDILTRIVQLSRRADPFSRSAAYFLMTGRKGLWVYGDDDTAMILARHPNREGHTLAFPPIGRDQAGLIIKALGDTRITSQRLELARVGAEDSALITTLCQRGATTAYPETVLDWAFPVHVISPTKIVARPGKPFISFRGHLHGARRAGLTAEAVDIRQHRAALTAAVHLWADQKRHHGFTLADLTGPTMALLDLMEEGGLAIKGTLTRDAAGQCIGFWLWEEAQACAYSLARVALRHPGNAELAIAHACDQLAPDGTPRIPEMCLGGSETAALDAFKRKMQPIRSIPLQTVLLRSTPAQDHTADGQPDKWAKMKLRRDLRRWTRQALRAGGPENWPPLPGRSDGGNGPS